METPTNVRVALTQMACGDDAEQNLQRQVALAERAAEAGAQIICTQELFRSKYFCQVEDHRFFQLAESIPGPSTDALAKVAKARGVVVVASLFERRAAGLYHNTAAVIDADGSLLGLYRKMHIPDDPLYLREVLFHPWRHGLSCLEDEVRHDRRADLLGPVVSRRRAADGDARRRIALLSDGHRMASVGEGRVRSRAA